MQVPISPLAPLPTPPQLAPRPSTASLLLISLLLEHVPLPHLSSSPSHLPDLFELPVNEVYQESLFISHNN